MNNILEIFQWWGQHANFLPWMFDHWIITWTLSSLATVYFMGYANTTSGESFGILNLIVILVLMPFIFGVVVLFIPVIVTFCILLALLVTMFTLGAITRRMQ